MYNINKLILIGTLSVLSLLVGWRVHQRRVERRTLPQRGGGRAVAVAVEPVRRKTLFEEAEFTGTLLPRSQFVVAPKVSGRLEKLAVDMGDEVRRGDLVAALDGEEYAQQVLQARAELDVARAALLEAESAREAAENDLERIRKLHDERVASDARLDEARARYRAADARVQVADAQIRQREASLKSAEARLAYTRLYAAWEGPGDVRRIDRRFADEGAMLRANDPVVSVMDTESLLAVIHVVERDFPAVVPGQGVMLRADAYPDGRFEGRVARRAPALDEQTRHARVEIELPNPDGKLAPGMFVRAVIRFAERTDAQAIPSSALVRRNGEQGVFVADTEAGVGRFVRVKTGVSAGDWTEILEPDIERPVITLGHHLLEDGAAIILPSERAPDASGPGRDRGGAGGA